MNYYEGCTLEEILAFRELESQVFDFGEGSMKMEGLLGSEDAYYEMALETFDDYNDLDLDCPDELIKPKHNHHYMKQKCKRKLEKLDKIADWWIIEDKGDYKTRNYRRPRCTKVYKRLNNKKIKQAYNLSNGGNYRKVYDYLTNVV